MDHHCPWYALDPSVDPVAWKLNAELVDFVVHSGYPIVSDTETTVTS